MCGVVERSQQRSLDVICIRAGLKAADKPLRSRDIFARRAIGIPADDAVWQERHSISVPLCLSAGAFRSFLQWANALPEFRRHTFNLDVLLWLIIGEVPQDMVALQAVPCRLHGEEVWEGSSAAKVDVDGQVTNGSLPQPPRLQDVQLSLIHISEPTRLGMISY